MTLKFNKLIAEYLDSNKSAWVKHFYSGGKLELVENSIDSLILNVANNTIDSFDFDENSEASIYLEEALSNIPNDLVDKLEKGGKIYKANEGTPTKKWYEDLGEGLWYDDLYELKDLTGWKSDLDASKAGNNLTSNQTHHLYGNLQGAYLANKAYTSDNNLVSSDLNTYYNNKYSGKSLDDYITGYNNDANTIRSHWSGTNNRYNDLGVASHNLLHKAMFANRNGDTNNAYDLGYAPSSENIQGSTTWMRRMDRYEKEFDLLSDEEKKARIHKIGDLGYVYKKANGDIAKLDNTEAERILNSTPKLGAEVTVEGVEEPYDETPGETKGTPTWKRALGAISNIDGGDVASLTNTIATNHAIRNNARKLGVVLPKTYAVTDNVRGDLGSKLYYAEKGNLERTIMNLLVKNATNALDAMAGALQGEMAAQQTEEKGKLIDNQAIAESEDKIQKYDEANIARATAAANEGADRLMAHHNEQVGYDMQERSQLGSVLNKEFAKMSYDKLKNDAQAKALKIQGLSSDMTDAINNHPDVLAYQLSYEKAQYNATAALNALAEAQNMPSSTEEEKAARSAKIQEATDAIKKANEDMYTLYYGFKHKTAELARLYKGKYKLEYYNTYGVNYEGNPFMAKKGAKLKALKTGSSVKVKVGGNDDGPVKTRTKDADRFRKRNRDADDYHNKAIDRLGRLIELYAKRAIGK